PALAAEALLEAAVGMAPGLDEVLALEQPERAAVDPRLSRRGRPRAALAAGAVAVSGSGRGLGELEADAAAQAAARQAELGHGGHGSDRAVAHEHPHVDVASGRLGVRADLVGGVHQLGGLVVVDPGHRAVQLDGHAEAAVVGLDEVDRGVDRELLGRDLLPARDERERAEEARAEAEREELLGVRGLGQVRGAPELGRRLDDQVRMPVGGGGAAVAAALVVGASGELGAQHRHRRLAVLGLRALVLALHDDAGGPVRDAHRRVGLVDVLAAGARRAVRVDLQVVGIDDDLRGVLDHRRDLDAREARLAPVGGVERAQAHEPVHAALGGVEAVRVLAADAERRRLDARLLPRARLEQLDLEAALLGPAHLHAQDHLGPVLRVGAAGARVDRDERVAGVVAAAEEALLLEVLEAALDVAELLLDLAGEVGVVAELDEVLDVALEPLELVELAADLGVLGVDLRRGLAVVPEAGRLHLLLERAPALAQGSGVLGLGRQIERRGGELVALGERIDVRADDVMAMGDRLHESGRRLVAQGEVIAARAAEVALAAADLAAAFPTLERTAQIGETL